jgi:hypothetical protein
MVITTVTHKYQVTTFCKVTSSILSFVYRESLYNLVNKAQLVKIFFSIFISFLYMFRATMCPSSGEITVYMWRLLIVILCGWLSGLPVGSTLRTRHSSTQSDKYQVSHRYSYLFWWWAHICPKHVEKRNKHTKKNCAPSWLYLQDDV